MSSPPRLAGRVLYEGEFSQLVAPSGQGKSFFGLDLALSIATGTPWLARPVRQGPVLYIAAEGAPGFRKRIIAWERARNISIDGAPFHFISEAANLLQKAAVDALIAAIQALPERPVLIVIDTLARSMAGGDENSPKDIGLVVNAVTRLQKTFAAHVMLLHHTGYQNTDRGRGHSSLGCALDTVLVLRAMDDLIRVENIKQKNAEPAEPFTIRLVPVEVGGETSCVVELADPSARPVEERLTPQQTKALTILRERYGEDGATYTEWRRSAGLSSSTMTRGVKVLVARGLVEPDRRGRGARYRATDVAGGHARHAHGTPMGANGGEHKSRPVTPTPPYTGVGGRDARCGSGVEIDPQTDPENPGVVEGVS